MRRAGSFLRSYLALFTLASAVIGLGACAAKLPREVTVRRPLGESLPFDPNAIEILRLSDQQKINLGQYMRDQQLKYLVLTFGSQGCSVCMQKARYLQANLVNNDYSLLGSSANKVVELVGVVTDPVSSRDELLSLVDREGLSHLTWWDPGHNLMMEYFQPEGRNFSVPLTLMVSQTEILWRVPSWEPISGPDLINKIASTLGVDANPPPIDNGGSGTGGTQDLLAREVPERLEMVKVSSCAEGQEATLGSLLPTGSSDFRAVLVHKNSCQDDDACVEAKTALNVWQQECSGKWFKDCAIREVVTDSSGCTEDQNLFVGGKEFFSVFSDHFNWSYKPIEQSPGQVKLGEVAGPLTLIFDRTGKLVFSREGSIGTDLTSRMNMDQLTEREEGPSFPVWAAVQSPPGKTSQIKNGFGQSFAELRKSSKYTLVMFWNTWCGSCLEELDEWHREDQSAYGFCREHSSFCQVVALETGRGETGLPPAEYLNGLLNGNDDFDGWVKKGWSMPLMVEDFPLADGRAPQGWFEGWYRARFGSKEPRNVLYDVEGKVVGSWLGLPGEHGPRDTLKKLFDSETKGDK